MEKNARSNLLLINPPVTRYLSFGATGLAYLKGYLAKYNINYDYFNLSRQINSEPLAQKKLKRFFIDKIRLADNVYKDSGFLETYSLNFLSEILLVHSKNGSLHEALTDFTIAEELLDISNIKDKEYVGISISFQNQIIFSLIIAFFVKKKFPNKKIILGGSFFAHCRPLFEFLERLPYSFEDYVDYLVVGEGESALLNILNNKPKNKIPNLIYWENGKAILSECYGSIEDFANDIPAPLFAPEEMPKLQISRSSCYYGRCLYCEEYQMDKNGFPLKKPKYSFKEPEQMLKEIKFLKNNYVGKKSDPFMFANNSMPIKFLKDFSKLIIKEGREHSFFTFLRLEEGLDYKTLKLAKKAGFGRTKSSMFYFGMETSNQRLSDLVNKGVNSRNAKRIIEDCGRLNIFSTIAFILNLPTQTYQELENDLNYIDWITKKYDNFLIGVNFFFLEKFSYFYFNKDKYDLEFFEFQEDKFDFAAHPIRHKSKEIDHVKDNQEARRFWFDFYNKLSQKQKNNIDSPERDLDRFS
jgi:radical SAM superfamily enzyme YgiQ (UPF0313 family)